MPPAFFVNQFWHIFDHMSKVTAKHENLKQPYLRILHGCTLAKITSKQTTDQSVMQKIRTGYTLLYFTVCLKALCVNALNSSYRGFFLYCKAGGFYTVSIQVPIFVSILPISLQQIASEKIYTVHSNELANGYTLMSLTIFIDKYWRATL